MNSGVPTVERLGSMTPEELLATEGIDQEGLERIGVAVNGYYSQYDQEQEAAPEAETTAEAVADAGEPAAEASSGDEAAPAGETEAAPADVETIEVAQDESATIKNAETEPIS